MRLNPHYFTSHQETKQQNDQTPTNTNTILRKRLPSPHKTPDDDLRSQRVFVTNSFLPCATRLHTTKYKI